MTRDPHILTSVDPRRADQIALLYRTGHLPTADGDTATELLYLTQYGDTLVITVPTVDLGNQITGGGVVTHHIYKGAVAARANFRLATMILTGRVPTLPSRAVLTGYGCDWTQADYDRFDPADLSTLCSAGEPS